MEKRVEIDSNASKDLELINKTFDGRTLVITFKNKTKRTLINTSISYSAHQGKNVVDIDKAQDNVDKIKLQQEVGFKAILAREADLVKITAVNAN